MSEDAISIIEVEVAELKAPSLLLRPIDNETVAQLARSIQHAGLLQPIMVRRDSQGYEVVFGVHRLEACRRLGMQRIPAIVSSRNADESILARISENLLRNTYMNPIEEAEGYKRLVAGGWTINAIGQKIGKCDSYVCERLAILDRLSHKLRGEISSEVGRLTASHAELISRIRDRTRQNVVAELVRRKRLSVRALEDMLNGVPPPTKVLAQNVTGGYSVEIPDEFARAMGLAGAQYLHMYFRGAKLILENLDTKPRRRRTRGIRVSRRVQYRSGTVTPLLSRTATEVLVGLS
jgi:ParB/RepB/Spo0J family partition protein